MTHTNGLKPKNISYPASDFIRLKNVPEHLTNISSLLCTLPRIKVKR